jgi:hypothetical protein
MKFTGGVESSNMKYTWDEVMKTNKAYTLIVLVHLYISFQVRNTEINKVLFQKKI